MTRELRALGLSVWVAGSACGEAPTPGPEALPELTLEVGIAASLETEDTMPTALKMVDVELVSGRTGPGGEEFYVARRGPGGADYLSRRIGQRTFALGLRVSSPELTQFPCTSCHEGQGIINDGVTRDGQGVHNNIQPVHPEETGAQCLTCHAANDVGTLGLESGDTAPITHSYRLCAQCHFPEVDSWAHGAHGKRLVGWRGRRVVLGCTDCHNPHRPATELRIPYPARPVPGMLAGEGHD